MKKEFNDNLDGPPPESYVMGAGGLYELWDSDGKNVISSDK